MPFFVLFYDYACLCNLWAVCESVQFCFLLCVFNSETERSRHVLFASCNSLQSAPACSVPPPFCHSPKYEADSGKQQHLRAKCARAHCRNTKHAHGSRLVWWAAGLAVGVGPLFPGSLRSPIVCRSEQRCPPPPPPLPLDRDSEAYRPGLASLGLAGRPSKGWTSSARQCKSKSPVWDWQACAP